MTQKPEDNLWVLITWVSETLNYLGYLIGTAAVGVLTWAIRQWRRDTKLLAELSRKMIEVDKIRVETEDGMKALRRLAEVDRELKAVKDTINRVETKQDEFARSQSKIEVTLGRVDENVKILRERR